MKYGVKFQDSYSRGELLLRTFFGAFYIAIPHAFLLLFVTIASMFVNFIVFWAILFTGKFPEQLFNFQLGFQRWNLRVSARLNNLSDGYPAFGLNGSDENTIIEIERPEKSNRGTVLLRVIFGGFYVMIPHGFVLLFLMIGVVFVRLISFWVILITGKHSKGLHDFMTGVSRWQFRVSAYMTYLTDVYPPFSLSGDEATFNNARTSEEVLDQF